MISTKKKLKLFPVDSVVAGARVLDVTHPGASAADVMYLVEFECCGDHYEMSHTVLRSRGTNDRKKCRKCSRKYNIAISLSRTEERDKRANRARETPGVYDLNGYFWPFLSGAR